MCIKVAFGRSVRFWNGFGISVFLVFDGQFEERGPSWFAGGGVWRGGRQPSHPGNARGSGGDTVPPSKINYLMSVSVRSGICFGPVGFAFNPYMKPTLVYVFHGFSCSSLSRSPCCDHIPTLSNSLQSMDIPASLQTTADVVASMFEWNADEAKSNMTVMECEVVKHGPNVPVLVVSMPSKPVDAPSRKRAVGGGMITVQRIPTFHDGRNGEACEKCSWKVPSKMHMCDRYHGTSSLEKVMAAGFKLKPSGKPDREKGEGPGFFHYGKEQWTKAFQYSGPQTLVREGLPKTPLLKVVCVVEAMCWNSCKGCDWGKTSAHCGRYAVTSLRIVQHKHCLGLVKSYDFEEVEESTFPIRSNPFRSDLLPIQPG